MSADCQEYLFGIYSSLTRWHCSVDAPELAENVMTQLPWAKTLETQQEPACSFSVLWKRLVVLFRSERATFFFCHQSVLSPPHSYPHCEIIPLTLRSDQHSRHGWLVVQGPKTQLCLGGSGVLERQMMAGWEKGCWFTLGRRWGVRWELLLSRSGIQGVLV